MADRCAGRGAADGRRRVAAALAELIADGGAAPAPTVSAQADRTSGSATTAARVFSFIPRAIAFSSVDTPGEINRSRGELFIPVAENTHKDIDAARRPLTT